jgi:hypothetical protein
VTLGRKDAIAALVTFQQTKQQNNVANEAVIKTPHAISQSSNRQYRRMPWRFVLNTHMHEHSGSFGLALTQSARFNPQVGNVLTSKARSIQSDKRIDRQLITAAAINNRTAKSLWQGASVSLVCSSECS